MNLRLYQKYLETQKLRPSTIRIYSWHLQHFFNWLENRPLDKEVLTQYYNWLLKHYKKIASINLRLIIINNYLQFNKNKFQFDLLSNEKAKVTTLTVKQLQNFLDIPAKKSDILHLRDKIILELLYYAGLKSGQLINIRREHINLQKNYLIVNQQKINLPETTKFYLVKYLNKRTDAIPWLLINLDRARKKSAGQLSIRSVERIIEKYARKTIPILNITPQTLRDSRAHHLKQDGGSATTIKDALQFKTKVGANNYFQKL